MKKLTLALTVYEPSKEEIDNFIFSAIEIEKIDSNNLIDFMIISDNPKISSYLCKYIEEKIKPISKIQFMVNDENLVRVGAVKVVQDKIKGDFIKLCDPDDFIIPDQTLKFVEEHLSKLDGDELVIYSYKTTTTKPTIANFEKANYNTFFWTASYNPNSVYSVEQFKKVEWDFKLLIWSDDLLGYLIWKESRKTSYAKAHKFYINNRAAGVSVTKSKHNSDRFYKDTELFLQKSIDNISSEEERESFLKLTHKPNCWLYNQVAQDLKYHEGKTNLEKIKILSDLKKLGMKITRKNKYAFKAADKQIKSFKTEKKSVTFIFPIYGKDSNYIYNLIDDTLSNKPDAKFILSYKNSEDDTFNYDLLNDLAEKYDDVKVIRNDSSLARTGKILQAINEVDTEYFQVVDAHHTLNIRSINRLNRYLIRNTLDHLLLPYVWRDIDSNTSKLRMPKQYKLGAGTSLYSTELIKQISSFIDVDIVYFDDISLTLYLYLFRDLYDYEILEKKKWFFHYNRNYGKEISGTTFTDDEMKTDLSLLSKQADHIAKLLNSIYKHINKIDPSYSKISYEYKELLSRYEKYIIWRNNRCGIDGSETIAKIRKGKYS